MARTRSGSNFPAWRDEVISAYSTLDFPVQVWALSFYALQAPFKHTVSCFLTSWNILLDEISVQIVIFLQLGQGFLALTQWEKHTFSMIYVLQRLTCPCWQMQSSGIHPSPVGCFPFLPNPVHKGTFPFLPPTSGEQNQFQSLHVTTCVIFLSDPQDNVMETACVLHQGGATHAPGTLYKWVSQEQPPVCDTAMQPVLLPDEFTCHNSGIIIKHLANLQLFAFIMSPAWQQTYTCCWFKGNIAQIAMQGFLIFKGNSQWGHCFHSTILPPLTPGVHPPQHSWSSRCVADHITQFVRSRLEKTIINLPELMNKQTSLIMGMLWQEEFPIQAFHSAFPKIDQDPQEYQQTYPHITPAGWSKIHFTEKNLKWEFLTFCLQKSMAHGIYQPQWCDNNGVPCWKVRLSITRRQHISPMYNVLPKMSQCFIKFCAVVFDLSAETE